MARPKDIRPLFKDTSRFLIQIIRELRRHRLAIVQMQTNLSIMASNGTRTWIDSEPARSLAFTLGVLLIVGSPIIGALPGPGGIFVFAAGLALCLRTSRWARRIYVRFKRWQPQAGRWADWGLRRRSAQRREAIRKEQKRRAQTEKAVGGD